MAGTPVAQETSSAQVAAECRVHLSEPRVNIGNVFESSVVK